MQSVSIIGVGRIGGALAIALGRAGYRIDYLVHRGKSTVDRVAAFLPSTIGLVAWSDLLPDLESDIVLITTPDPDISPVAEALNKQLTKRATILHTSGSLSSQSLSALSNSGHFIASMHPLVSVSDAIAGADSFSNSHFCVEGDETAVATAREIVGALGGHFFSIDPEQKPLYHAAAVTAAGHLVALVDIAMEMLSKCGIAKPIAKEILLPLISSTIANLHTQSPEQALTGSFARLDVDAVRRHLSAIDRETFPDQVRDVYLELGERSLDLAATNGGDAGDVRKLRELISIAKRKSG